jgi:hypothetical protein
VEELKGEVYERKGKKIFILFSCIFQVITYPTFCDCCPEATSGFGQIIYPLSVFSLASRPMAFHA